VLDEEDKRVTLAGTKAGPEVTRLVPLLPEVAAIVDRRSPGTRTARCFPRLRARAG